MGVLDQMTFMFLDDIEISVNFKIRKSELLYNDIHRIIRK